MKTRTKVAAGAGGIALVTGSLIVFVGGWEGREYKPYWDGLGRVWTVCNGITGERVIPGRTYTKAECDAFLAEELEDHGGDALACIRVPITQKQYEAVASFTFNLGPGPVCNGSLGRAINSGMPASEWCKVILLYDKAGRPPKQVRGLTRRRQAEYALCTG